jgi:hypothetical protein
MAIWNSDELAGPDEAVAGLGGAACGAADEDRRARDNLLWQNEQRALTREQRAHGANRDVVECSASSSGCSIKGFSPITV